MRLEGGKTSTNIDSILVCRDDRGLGVWVVSDETGDSAIESRHISGRIRPDTAPDLAINTSRMSLHPHSGNNRKLVTTALERKEQLRLRSLVGVGNGAIREDYFVVVDIVAGETLLMVRMQSCCQFKMPTYVLCAVVG